MKITGWISAIFGQSGMSYLPRHSKMLILRAPPCHIFFIKEPVKSFLAHNMIMIILPCIKSWGPPLYLTAICRELEKLPHFVTKNTQKSTQQLFIFAKEVCYTNDVMEKAWNRLEGIRQGSHSIPWNNAHSQITLCATLAQVRKRTDYNIYSKTWIHTVFSFILINSAYCWVEACTQA